jgi:hypothetical protein
MNPISRGERKGTILSSSHISKVTGMAVLIFWCPMLLAIRIEVWPCSRKQFTTVLFYLLFTGLFLNYLMISKKKREKIIDKLKTAKGCETSHKRRRIENNLGTSGHAAIGGVTKSVHMEPVEPPGLSLEMLPVTVVGPYISTNKANGFETSHKRRRIGHEESKKKVLGITISLLREQDGALTHSVPERTATAFPIA